MAEQRKMNKFIIVFVVIIVLLVVVLLVKSKQPKYKEISQLPTIESPEKAQDGDTQADTIRALQAYAKEAVDKAEMLNDQTLTQSKQVQENKKTVSSLTRENDAIKEALENTKEDKESLEQQLSELNRRLDTFIEQKKREEAEIPVGFGFDNSSVIEKNTQGQWYNPVDYVDTAENDSNTVGFGLLTPNANRSSSSKDSDSGNRPTNEPPPSETVAPYVTIHKDAILFDSLAFTALIGRIPVDGITPDPYPVKIFIGKESLLANGFDLPEVEGMVFSGHGYGDENFSCVRARLYSATFIFADGSIVNQTEDEPLAYISDRVGFPCVSGKYVGNAREFITQQVLLSGLGVAGSTYADAQLETIQDDEGKRTTNLTGDIRKLVAGNVVQSSTNEVTKWLLSRQKQIFAAVIVNPGEQVSVHIEKEIIIDDKEFARKVRYPQQSSLSENTLD